MGEGLRQRTRGPPIGRGYHNSVSHDTLELRTEHPESQPLPPRHSRGGCPLASFECRWQNYSSKAQSGRHGFQTILRALAWLGISASAPKILVDGCGFGFMMQDQDLRFGTPDCFLVQVGRRPRAFFPDVMLASLQFLGPLAKLSARQCRCNVSWTMLPPSAACGRSRISLQPQAGPKTRIFAVPSSRRDSDKRLHTHTHTHTQRPQSIGRSARTLPNSTHSLQIPLLQAVAYPALAGSLYSCTWKYLDHRAAYLNTKNAKQLASEALAAPIL